jgi:hypothetical protein
LTAQLAILGVTVVVSTAYALFLVERLWRSDEVLFLKAMITVFLLIPVLGPLFVLWLYKFPSVVPPDLQDRSPLSTDVLDRWRDRLEGAGKLPKRRRTADKRAND